ncbi:MAG: 30S ribosomal protein S4 [Patescibacteria group bacterium]|nr:30S ribosomal protein S4 [Patescibacteria group bacterium]
MKVGPKYKICKRLGASVFEKCQTQRFQVAEARSPRKTSRSGARGGSDFGPQLLEKQKARFTYGLTERQFSRYAKEVMGEHGSNSALALLARLESRLDNVVFRAGFVTTRRAARQIVTHGHITLNGRRMNVPSHQVKKGDVIAIRSESRISPLFSGRSEKAAEQKTPAWMAIEEGGFAAKIASVPALSATEVAFDPAVIIQFYSR